MQVKQPRKKFWEEQGEQTEYLNKLQIGWTVMYQNSENNTQCTAKFFLPLGAPRISIAFTSDQQHL